MNFQQWIILPCMSLLVSCTTADKDPNVSVYSSDAVGSFQQTLYGTIISAQPVIVKKDRASGVGTSAGGIAGATVGALIGGSENRWIGAGLGGGAGLLGGHLISQHVGQKDEMMYQVRLDSGAVYSMIQPKGLVENQKVIVVLPKGNVPGKLIPCDK